MLGSAGIARVTDGLGKEKESCCAALGDDIFLMDEDCMQVGRAEQWAMGESRDRTAAKAHACCIGRIEAAAGGSAGSAWQSCWSAPDSEGIDRFADTNESPVFSLSGSDPGNGRLSTKVARRARPNSVTCVAGANVETCISPTALLRAFTLSVSASQLLTLDTRFGRLGADKSGDANHATCLAHGDGAGAGRNCDEVGCLCCFSCCCCCNMTSN